MQLKSKLQNVQAKSLDLLLLLNLLGTHERIHFPSTSFPLRLKPPLEFC